MVTEFAEIDVKPGMAAQFRTGVAASLTAFTEAAGCHGVELHQSIETPEHFVLAVKWETVAHHTEVFRNSPGFQIWRANVGECFAGPPKVWHSETVVMT
jgi:quinol monooxygenase YgiN